MLTPKYSFPEGFDIYHTPNHYANEETCLRFVDKIVIPYIQQTREAIGTPSQKALLIMDNFTSQTTTSVIEKAEEQGIIIVMVPAGTTDSLQPLDVSVNKAAKAFYKKSFVSGMQSKCKNSFRQAKRKEPSK